MTKLFNQVVAPVPGARDACRAEPRVPGAAQGSRSRRQLRRGQRRSVLSSSPSPPAGERGHELVKSTPLSHLYIHYTLMIIDTTLRSRTTYRGPTGGSEIPGVGFQLGMYFKDLFSIFFIPGRKKIGFVRIHTTVNKH